MSKLTATELLGETADLDYTAGPGMRTLLASTLETMLEAAGFRQEATERGAERVFSREIPDTKIRVQVFTTIVETGPLGMGVRDEGADAIRVAAVYVTSEGKERGIVSATRVNRTGKVGAIVERTLARMREVWTKAKTGERCHCGAPKFTSKAGKLVCADLCWLPADQRDRPLPQRAPNRWAGYRRPDPNSYSEVMRRTVRADMWNRARFGST